MRSLWLTILGIVCAATPVSAQLIQISTPQIVPEQIQRNERGIVSVRVMIAGVEFPQGNVRFVVDGQASQLLAEISDGVAQMPISFDTSGDHTIIAEYLFPGLNLTIVRSSLGINVRTRTTITWPTARVEAHLGAPITLFANVLPAGTLGPVELYDGEKRLGTFQIGSARPVELRVDPAIHSLGVGEHSMALKYLGSAFFYPTTSPALPVVIRTVSPVKLSVAPSPVALESTVSLTATVAKPSPDSVDPTGMVRFLVGQELLGVAELNGGAATLSLAATRLGSGTRSVIALYDGDRFYGAIDSTPVQVTVRGRPTTTGLSVSLGERVKLEAGVASNGAPVNSGTVRFVTSGESATAPVVQGVAAFLGAPNQWLGKAVTARFEGDAAYEPSDSPPTAVIAPVNGFSFQYGPLAPGEIVSLFFPVLGSAVTAPAAAVRGADQVTRAAHLYFASDTQATFALPNDLPPGPATLSYTPGAGDPAVAGVEVVRTAPGLATASANGQGPPAAQVLRIRDGASTIEPFGALAFHGDTLYLVLYGTGFRHASSPVTCVAADRTMTAAFAGPQGEFPGLDQINLPLDATLAGAGTVAMSCSADGRVSNAVSLLFP